MLKELIAIRSFKNIDNEDIVIKYYITKMVVYLDETIYGIRIERYKKDFFHNEVFDSFEEVLKLSYNFDKVYSLINLLADALVTPITLINILDDICID